MDKKQKISSCVEMPKITECKVLECSYNGDNMCRAIAVTIGDGRNPLCDTYYNTTGKGGVRSMKGGVGACKVAGCSFNTDLECMADPGIKVSPVGGRPHCTTFKQA